MLMLTPVILFLVAIILLDFYRVLSYKGRLIGRIPGPQSLPIIGNTYRLLLPLDKLFSCLREFYKIYGDIYQLHAINVHAVNISNPRDVEVVLSSSRFNEKQIPYTFLRPWLCEGLLVSNGNKWQQRRKLLTRAFHFNILKRYLRTFIEQTEELLAKVHLEVGEERTDLLPLLTRATLNIMCETAMGTSMHKEIQSVSSKYFEAIHVIGQSIAKRLVRVWLFFDLLFAYSKIGKTQNQAIKELHQFTMQIIKERKEYLEKNNITVEMDENNEVYGDKGRLAMLDLLIQNEKDGAIDLIGIREEVDTFMFEGHDTTAAALSFMIMRIANETSVQNLIYEELFRIFGDSLRPPTTEDLNKMNYLECCIKESLRIYPSVPFISRYLTEDVELSGYKVPAGTLCQIHVYDIHHRRDIYPDPEKFLPDRFFQENINKRHPYSYLPFSAGPRNCIGQKFAMLEMKIVMSGLLRKFRLKPDTKPENVTLKCDLVLRASHPIYVRFHKRT